MVISIFGACGELAQKHREVCCGCSFFFSERLSSHNFSFFHMGRLDLPRPVVWVIAVFNAPFYVIEKTMDGVAYSALVADRLANQQAYIAHGGYCAHHHCPKKISPDSIYPGRCARHVRKMYEKNREYHDARYRIYREVFEPREAELRRLHLESDARHNLMSELNEERRRRCEEGPNREFGIFPPVPVAPRTRTRTCTCTRRKNQTTAM